jgi:hypothetical protein
MNRTILTFAAALLLSSAAMAADDAGKTKSSDPSGQMFSDTNETPSTDAMDESMDSADAEDPSKTKSSDPHSSE